MAEAFLRRMDNRRFEVESAGIFAGTLDPLAVSLMREIGIDICRNCTKSISSLIKIGKVFDYIFVLISDLSTILSWPVFPGEPKIYYYENIPALSALKGNKEAKLTRGRELRNQIQKLVERLAERVVVP